MGTGHTATTGTTVPIGAVGPGIGRTAITGTTVLAAIGIGIGRIATMGTTGHTAITVGAVIIGAATAIDVTGAAGNRGAPKRRPHIELQAQAELFFAVCAFICVKGWNRLDCEAILRNCRSKSHSDSSD